MSINSNHKTNTRTAAEELLYNAELDKIKVNVRQLNAETEDEAFALLRSSNGNWSYAMRKLHCIIGRAPAKYGVILGSAPNTSIKGNTKWEVDVDLGQHKRISKQHALIAYNFHAGSFEIKNLSKKFPLKVNGEVLKHNEEMLLTTKSSIVIANNEFYFLLPS